MVCHNAAVFSGHRSRPNFLPKRRQQGVQQIARKRELRAPVIQSYGVPRSRGQLRIVNRGNGQEFAVPCGVEVVAHERASSSIRSSVCFCASVSWTIFRTMLFCGQFGEIAVTVYRTDGPDGDVVTRFDVMDYSSKGVKHETCRINRSLRRHHVPCTETKWPIARSAVTLPNQGSGVKSSFRRKEWGQENYFDHCPDQDEGRGGPASWYWQISRGTSRSRRWRSTTAR